MAASALLSTVIILVDFSMPDRKRAVGIESPSGGFLPECIKQIFSSLESFCR